MPLFYQKKNSSRYRLFTYLFYSRIRLEFHQAELDYCTAIDGLLLGGYYLRPSFNQNQEPNLLEKCLMRMKTMFVKKKRKKIIIGEVLPEKCYFSTLPVSYSREILFWSENKCFFLQQELIVHIFGFLDLHSLFNCALVCRAFYTASNDSRLFRDLSLKVSVACLKKILYLPSQ